MDPPCKSSAEPAPPPWQPLTFGGVARFATARLSRLLAVQAIVALIVSLSVVGFLQTAWLPVWQEALERLPDDGIIGDGRLQWPDSVPRHLADNPFLSIAADLDEFSEVGETADLQVEFARTELKLRSLLGYVALPYPERLSVHFNRKTLVPWWGAWQPVVVTGLAAGIALGLGLCWAGLGLVWMLPVRALACLADRQLSLGGAWKLTGAALLPAALWMAAAVLLYSQQFLTLLQLIVACGLHLLIGLVYVLTAPSSLPSLKPRDRPDLNPFAGATSPATKPSPSNPNPFSGDCE